MNLIDYIGDHVHIFVNEFLMIICNDFFKWILED